MDKPPKLTNPFLQSDSLPSPWDEWFRSVWKFLIMSVWKHYHVQGDDASELAATTLTKFFKTFPFETIKDLTQEECEKVTFAYVKCVLQGVASEFFAVRNTETLLPAEMAEPSANFFLTGLSPEEFSPPVRKALNKLDKWDRRLVEYRAINRWTYTEIQEEFLALGDRATKGALQMRFARAIAELRKTLSREDSQPSIMNKKRKS